MDKLLTCEQVAAELQVKTETVWAWIRQGKIPAYKVGSLYRVSAAELDGFLSGSKVTGRGREKIRLESKYYY